MTAPLLRREEAERRERQVLAPLACFADAAGARPDAEADDPFRTCFVRDRDRVIHCGAFRRLKDKTQVFVIDEGDFYRTRLTHTLEVAQMTRYLCLALRLNDALGEVLALAHDIGHPPFGHEGERVLDERSSAGFDHNRQALRIVDVLESPYADRRGLNLTHAVRRGLLKHGGAVGRGAIEAPGHVLEVQATDLADSIAYRHHDLEDALRAGILTEEELSDLPAWAEAVAAVDGGDARGRRDEGATRPTGRPRRKAILSHLLKATLVDALETSAGALEACDAHSAEEIAARELRLIVLSPTRGARHAELGRFLMERFYKHPRVMRSAEVARDAIARIVDHYTAHSDELPRGYRERIEDHGLARSVCDYVAGMTDRFASDEWRRLSLLRGVTLVRSGRGGGDGDGRSPDGGHATHDRRGHDDADGRGGAPTERDADLARVTQLEQRIGHAFRDADLAITALTHASARSDEQAPNERLEFLGDSVLGLLVAQELFERFPDRNEGELSRMKSAVVSRHALRTVARHWSLVELLTLGPGFRSDDEIPPSVVADAVEAVLGALYLDAGADVVRHLVRREFGPLMDRVADRSRASNHKSELQSFTQGNLGLTPHYRIVTEEGPDHRKTFTVAAVVGEVELAVARGRNKREAEQRAARDGLARLHADAPDADVEALLAAGRRNGGAG